jgi:hypothetical protein
MKHNLVIHSLPNNQYQVKTPTGTVTAKSTTLKKAHYHKGIVDSLNEQFMKNPQSGKKEYHQVIKNSIEQTRAALAERTPGAPKPDNPGADKLGLQKLAQAERDAEANRRLNTTPVRMGGPSSSSTGRTGPNNKMTPGELAALRRQQEDKDRKKEEESLAKGMYGTAKPFSRRKLPPDMSGPDPPRAKSKSFLAAEPPKKKVVRDKNYFAGLKAKYGNK